jgi:hypothetical protein
VYLKFNGPRVAYVGCRLLLPLGHTEEGTLG